ncbi:hypothetical protein, partial [Rhodoplanes sp. SY1]|uniref:hypothetical protein n=1 Tax=Rhodoplanes sp. SY1 TaxID=3166646 RepID=UPI0038B57AF4
MLIEVVVLLSRRYVKSRFDSRPAVRVVDGPVWLGDLAIGLGGIPPEDIKVQVDRCPYTCPARAAAGAASPG